MLLARIQRAAKLGDVDAQRYVALCELNVTTATRLRRFQRVVRWPRVFGGSKEIVGKLLSLQSSIR